jgi:flagellar hook-basal body complex protein FliE
MTAPVQLPDRLTFGRELQPLQTPKPADKADGTVQFSDQLKNFVGEVDALQKQAETKSENFANGKSNDIHGTMIAVEQADISLHLLANVRNRVIEMYREVMRMGS